MSVQRQRRSGTRQTQLNLAGIDDAGIRGGLDRGHRRKRVVDGSDGHEPRCGAKAIEDGSGHQSGINSVKRPHKGTHRRFVGRLTKLLQMDGKLLTILVSSNLAAEFGLSKEEDAKSDAAKVDGNRAPSPIGFLQVGMRVVRERIGEPTVTRLGTRVEGQVQGYVVIAPTEKDPRIVPS